MKKFSILTIITSIVTIIVLILLTVYLSLWNYVHIDTKLCLAKDNFTEKYDYIQENLSEDGIVLDKYIKTNNNKDFYFCSIKTSSEDYSIESEVTKEEYDKIDINDKVCINREVFYTKTGLRLFYIDSLDIKK